MLNQIQHHAYEFQTYAASRIQEIREATMNYKIKWIHVSSANNMADILTRQYSLTTDSYYRETLAGGESETLLLGY